MEFILGTQSWYNVQISINIIDLINKLKKISSIYVVKLYDEHPIMMKTRNRKTI